MSAVISAIQTTGKQPRVFTDAFLDRLKVLNGHIRMLRKSGYRTLSVDLLGKRPSMLVDGQAAGLLRRAGHGCASRLLPGGGRVYSIVVDCCEIRWEEISRGNSCL